MTTIYTGIQDQIATNRAAYTLVDAAVRPTDLLSNSNAYTQEALPATRKAYALGIEVFEQHGMDPSTLETPGNPHIWSPLRDHILETNAPFRQNGEIPQNLAELVACVIGKQLAQLINYIFQHQLNCLRPITGSTLVAASAKGSANGDTLVLTAVSSNARSIEHPTVQVVRPYTLWGDFSVPFPVVDSGGCSDNSIYDIAVSERGNVTAVITPGQEFSVFYANGHEHPLKEKPLLNANALALNGYGTILAYSNAAYGRSYEIPYVRLVDLTDLGRQFSLMTFSAFGLAKFGLDETGDRMITLDGKGTSVTTYEVNTGIAVAPPHTYETEFYGATLNGDYYAVGGYNGSSITVNHVRATDSSSAIRLGDANIYKTPTLFVTPNGEFAGAVDALNQAVIWCTTTGQKIVDVH